MKQSAGILLYRKKKTRLEVMLVHPGGPFWKNKDAGAWSVPKGEFTDDENALEAAKREFKEETGFICAGKFVALSPVKLKSGKTIYAWALKMDMATEKIKSNDFEMEWPPKSGKMQRFPEVDKAQWFSVEEAKNKINAAQAALLDELITVLEKS